MARTYVIGAGLAGLSAALTLSRGGRAVTLIEATKRAGGRCRSFHDSALDCIIDNGNHLVMSGNKAAMKFLDEVGTRHRMVGPRSAAFPFVDIESGRRWTVRPNRGPIPFWVFAPWRRVPRSSFLSFLPLSHTFERTCGYYLTIMCGATVTYARGIPQLGEDLQTVKPTMLISVPRIYERIWGAIRAKLDEGSPLKKKLFMLAVDVGYARFEQAMGRASWKPSFLLWPLLNKLVASKVLARLGGRMRAAMSGGAALPPDISRVFIGLGLPVLQGYGLTETSPMACANSPSDNLPASVGKPMPGVQVKIGDNNALLIKGPNIMLGYWNNEAATKAMIQPDGWLNSGDTGRIDEQGHVFITGRIKEIIVMSNGEKLPPVDMENAILRDPLFEQVMMLGEAKPYLGLLAVLNADHWKKLAAEKGWKTDDPALLTTKEVETAVTARVGAQLKEFPGYAQVRRVSLSLEPWTMENGLLTPTLKLKRPKVMEKFVAEIDHMYAGH